MSRPVILERQNCCLDLSCSVLTTEIALWPSSGHDLAQSGYKFLYGFLEHSPVVVVVHTEGHLTRVLNEWSVSDGRNSCPLWLVILKSV